MDAFKALLTRRSDRRFCSRKIEGDKLMSLLEAAMQAPSAGNEQPWHFVVIDDGAKLEELSRIHPYAAMLSQAAAAIVVCAEMELVKHGEFWVQDCAAATQNILIAARACQIGAVWLGMYPRTERCEAAKICLGMPEQTEVFCIVALGYPENALPAVSRFDPSRIHNNRW